MDLKDGKILLKTLKPTKGEPPAFGDISFDRIILEHLKSSPSLERSENPSVLILCGPPGCGKSTVKTNLCNKFSIENYINIDPDEIRTIIMSQGVRFPDDKTMSGITNNFNKRISDYSIEQGYNIVFDTTGQNFKAVSDLIYQSSQRGYKTFFTIIWASLDTCLRRVNGRNQYLRESGSGRIELPIELAEYIYYGFTTPVGTASRFLLDYPVKANEVFLYNNNIDGKEPELLYHKKENDVDFATNFSGFYNMNINFQPPYITKKSSGGRKRKTKRNKKSRKNRRTRRR